jgi:hypothetical protein
MVGVLTSDHVIVFFPIRRKAEVISMREYVADAILMRRAGGAIG